jgi:signal transduction histidine kinase
MQKGSFWDKMNEMSLASKFVEVFRCVLLCACMALGLSRSAAQTNEILTNAADVISLPAARAWQHIKISVTGVVTAADPAMKGRFFVQDSTGGVFVDNANGQRLAPGDVVEVSGISDAGAFAPIIANPQVRKVGSAPLPLARPVSLERLMSGAEDSQRIEISGTVRAVRFEGGRLVVDLVSSGCRFRAFVATSRATNAEMLVAAQVLLRGTAAEAHNRSLRQFIRAEIYVPGLDDFQVQQREAADPFDQRVNALGSLAQYRRDISPNQRVHVRGVVTLQRLGENVFLQDATGGLRIQSRQQAVFSPGEVVEAVGFPSFENYLPVLQDAVLRGVPQARTAVKPKPATIAELQQGLHHADYIYLHGKLINRTTRDARHQKSSPPNMTTTLVLQETNVIFTAEAEEPMGEADLTSIPMGSTVEVSGVCLAEIDSEGKMKSFQILLPNAAAARILAKPSWLTPGRLLIGLGVLGFVLVVIASWSVMVSKKNRALNLSIREREKAQLELQQAHDQLEQRVKERTAELKFQISARKESELQFKAVLGERTRLAQELHDTVEQTLTGIALQLDTAAKLYERSPEGTRRHLSLARNLMTKSQVEVRRSVWDLRCRALEQFDLAGALLASARQMTCGSRIQVDLETRGQTCALPEVVEENLLRIGQEAITNVIKHSGATKAKIKLEFGPQHVILEIQDNGKGFEPAHVAGPDEGHFGLLGMSERAKRLSGHLRLTSAPETGAVVRAEIPLNDKTSAPPPTSVNGHKAKPHAADPARIQPE